MKRRTALLAALMYAVVFLACIGVLYVLDRMTQPAGPGGETESGYYKEETVPETEETTAGAETESASEESREEEEQAGGYDPAYGYQSWETSLEGVWTPPEEEAYTPPTLILATDLHYQSHEAGDGGAAIQEFIAACDGKVVEYLPELLDAFMDEVIEARPSALVLSGDITMNGERLNHLELSERLKKVQEAGIQVLVIPGNHDINNTNAAVYLGEQKTQAESITGGEFYEIYHEYGYDQAFSRDEASLSYAYALDEKNWLIMLDSAQYDPVNRVEGRIKEETMEWMEGILKQAKEEGCFVLPIAHHNLMNQSRMYPTQCEMENGPEVVTLLEKYQVPLFMSGHLHVQRIKKYKSEPGVGEEAYGIFEIITDALSIPPCQYGQLVWQEDGSLDYSTRSVDVSAWAARTGNENPELRDFESWSYEYIKELISAQIGGSIRNLGEEITDSMAAIYAQVYMDYYAGRKIEQEEIRGTKGYQWWERNLPDSRMLDEMERMMEDADRDNNYLMVPGV